MAGFDRVTKTFAKRPGVTLEKGWGSDNLTLKLDGKIFAMLVRGDLVVKLPKPRVDELVAAGCTRFDPRRDGRVMKEWVVVGAKDGDWLGLARQAHRFCSANRRGR